MFTPRVIFLNRELRLAKFTSAATVLFHFIESKIGRPLSDLSPRFAGTDLLADVKDVLRSLVPVEREVRAGEAWFILRVLPYRTIDNTISGAVITFADVTRLKRAEVALRERERLLRGVMDGSQSIVFLKDLQGRFLTTNKRFEGLLGIRREDLMRKTDYDLFPQERDEDAPLRAARNAAPPKPAVEGELRLHIAGETSRPWLRSPTWSGRSPTPAWQRPARTA